MTRGFGLTAPSTMLLRRSSICGRRHLLRPLVADEAGDLGGVLDEVPDLLAHLHLDEDVAGEAGLLARAALTAGALLGHRLGRDEDLAEAVLHVVLLDALEERLFDLVLVSRVGLDDVPLLGHDVLRCLPYTRLVTKPQNRSISAKKTVDTTVVTMTTTVPLVTSVRVGQVTLDISVATSSAS